MIREDWSLAVFARVIVNLKSFTYNNITDRHANCRSFMTDYFVIWPTTSCCADWSKRDHVTLVIIGCCTLEHVTVQHVHVARATCFDIVAHVARLLPKLTENENRTNTSNLRWYTGIMQECECTATTYNLLTNYLSLREILIKCYNYKHSQKQLKVPPGEW